MLVLVPLLCDVDEKWVGRLALVASALSLFLIFAFLAAGITSDEILNYRFRHTFGTKSVPFLMNVVFGAGAMLLTYVRKYGPRGGLPFAWATWDSRHTSSFRRTAAAATSHSGCSWSSSLLFHWSRVPLSPASFWLGCPLS